MTKCLNLGRNYNFGVDQPKEEKRLILEKNKKRSLIKNTFKVDTLCHYSSKTVRFTIMFLGYHDLKKKKVKFSRELFFFNANLFLKINSFSKISALYFAVTSFER